MTQRQQPSRGWSLAGAGALAVGACAVCCAGPILAVLGGLSVVSLAGAVWIPGLAFTAVLALLGMAWVLRRRRRATCATSTETVDLGMPAAPGSDQADPAGRLR